MVFVLRLEIFVLMNMYSLSKVRILMMIFRMMDMVKNFDLNFGRFLGDLCLRWIRCGMSVEKIVLN